MPYDIVKKFEETIAELAGAKYGVAVDSCCNALFLCCIYANVALNGRVTIPKRTYPGVACAIINAGGRVDFDERYWDGAYQLEPYHIWDSALRFCPGMYVKGSLYCLSFHAKKHLPIGRGGMILCDDFESYKWFRKARFDGRSELPLAEDNITMVGWNCYMTPEQAARGLTLFEVIKNRDLSDISDADQDYPDLSKIEAYKI